ncbi:L-threonine 3-dehydrogenase [Abditibacteriota bacterium]|nr:L-threonine 3-dehydrogenase [Abditibacteriota bacterium]
MSTQLQEVTVPHFIGNRQIGVTTQPIPQVGPGQLLLKPKANALCGSERPQWINGTDITPGHEAAGIVIAAGEGTTTPVGTPGVVFLMDFCGECRNCRQGFTNQCLHKRGDMGFNRNGGYGQYELIHENLFFPVGDLPLTEATLLLDIMGTGGHAIKRAGLVHSDIRTILIPGAGPIGLGVLAMAKLLLGNDVKVVISDVVPYRLKLAEQMGGLPVNSLDMTLAEGLKHHGAEAPDVSIDCAGKAVVRDECLDLLAHRGVLVSVAHGEGLSINNLYSDFVAREMTLVSSEYFAYHELEENLPLLLANRSYMDQIITHRLGVDEIQHAFELFFGGETGKVVIEQ